MHLTKGRKGNVRKLTRDHALPGEESGCCLSRIIPPKGMSRRPKSVQERPSDRVTAADLPNMPGSPLCGSARGVEWAYA